MPVFELRVAISTEEYESLLAFYRDGLGLEPGATWSDHGRGQLLNAGRAVLEILDTEHSEFVDQVEVGQRVSGKIRFAIRVPDIEVAVENALRYGATLVHEPVRTMWNDYNARIESPDGMQITLFQT